MLVCPTSQAVTEDYCWNVPKVRHIPIYTYNIYIYIYYIRRREGGGGFQSCTTVLYSQCLRSSRRLVYLNNVYYITMLPVEDNLLLRKTLVSDGVRTWVPVVGSIVPYTYRFEPASSHLPSTQINT